ncbi:polysaccharide biosynthesis tyrosine autokinase [Cytophagaceae bacterium ABcell3]|nr:polysaccharide biosynthesis tyrosine autokinase [Cytophagaceae bacterium ABcell3]
MSSEEYNNHNKVSQNYEPSNGDFFDDFDLAKLLYVTSKSLIWVILLLVVTGVGTHLILRYTKPVYQSSAIIKLDLKTEAGVLGFNDVRESQTQSKLSNISGEIELIKSNIVYDKLIDMLDLNVSYFQHGNILFEERFKISPFKVEYEINNPSFFDQVFDLKIIDDKEFLLSFNRNGIETSGTYQFDQVIKDPAFTFKISLTEYYDPQNPQNFFFTVNSRKSMAQKLAKNLDVSILNLDANTIEITYKDHDRHKAKEIIDAVCQIYLEQTVENKSKAQEQTIKFLDETLEATEAKLIQSEVQLESFIRKNKTVNVKDDVTKVVKKIEELEGEKLELRHQLSLLNELKHLIEEGKDMKLILPSLAFFSDEQLSKSITSLTQLQQERDLALASSKENTFIIRSKDIAIENLKETLSGQITRNKKVIMDQFSELNSKIMELERMFLTLPSKETEYTRLKRFYDIYEKYYMLLMEKKAEFGIAKAGNVPNFVLLSPASVQEAPIFPNKLLFYIAGIALGLFLGISLIIVRYILHNTITTQKELEAAVKAPVLGGVPVYKKEKLGVSKLIVHKSPKSAISESLRSIRTNLEFICPGKKKKILSVTSTVSSEGKTFVTSNLSGIIALSDQKTVVIDLDMRKPKLHLAFNGSNSKGMSTLLIGKHTLDECLQASEISNLDLISAGPVPPNPAELIMRPEFDALLQQLHKVYDTIVIDTPPVGLVTDGILIMKKADIALYVVRANYTKKAVKNNINKLISSTGLTNISVVLNAMTNISNYGYGVYGNYGSSGYGYYEEEQEKKPLIKRFPKIFS